jgi:two-component system response regulator YesN
MEQAARLLEDGGLKIYEVAEKVGIPNYRYFTLKFHEWYGISPKDFQKKRK